MSKLCGRGQLTRAAALVAKPSKLSNGGFTEAYQNDLYVQPGK
jgi:hypothetical protein